MLMYSHTTSSCFSGVVETMELSPEGWGQSGSRPLSLFLGRGVILAEGLHDLGKRAVPPFQLYAGICLTTKVEAEAHLVVLKNSVRTSK